MTKRKWSVLQSAGASLRLATDRAAIIVSPGVTTAEVDAMLEKCKADAEAEIEAAVVANLIDLVD